jgi:hypothetical protein
VVVAASWVVVASGRESGSLDAAEEPMGRRRPQREMEIKLKIKIKITIKIRKDYGDLESDAA